MENQYNNNVSYALRLAKILAERDGQHTYGVPHLVLALLDEPTGLPTILNAIGKDVEYVKEWFDVQREMYKSQPRLEELGITADASVTKVLQEAERSQLKLGTEFIDESCVFSAIVREGVVYDSLQIETIMVSESDFTRRSIKTNKVAATNTVVTSTGVNGENKKIPFCTPLLTAENLEEGALVILIFHN